MQIMLTNDDGIYAPGLAAMEQALARLGDVCVVSPATEQSGVGHSITFLSPLMAKEVFDGPRRRGWAVEGSPADCVKLGLARFSPKPPELLVSGINGGLNVGINVLYSGTVAAATEGALYEIPSIAVSLEYDRWAKFDVAAQIATGIIEQMLRHNAFRGHRLYNLNIPTSATIGPSKLKIVPMGVARWPAEFEERRDPKGRRYYWASGAPPLEMPGPETDLVAIKDGFVTLSPLSIDRSNHALLPQMRDWNLQLPPSTELPTQGN
jgi:5'-nucleotidase